MKYWLLKSEPGSYGIDDLERDRRTAWDGVRNYQARNFLRSMAPGDEAFFYHSGCPEPGIAGVMRTVSTAFSDPTQFDPTDHHYDSKSTLDSPRWSAVEVEFVTRFSSLLSLQRLREEKSLHDLVILRRGNRLSVTPVTIAQWRRIEAVMHANNSRK